MFCRNRNSADGSHKLFFVYKSSIFPGLPLVHSLADVVLFNYNFCPYYFMSVAERSDSCLFKKFITDKTLLNKHFNRDSCLTTLIKANLSSRREVMKLSSYAYHQILGEAEINTLTLSMFSILLSRDSYLMRYLKFSPKLFFSSFSPDYYDNDMQEWF